MQWLNYMTVPVAFSFFAGIRSGPGIETRIQDINIQPYMIIEFN